jgi:hypothetical protein
MKHRIIAASIAVVSLAVGIWQVSAHSGTAATRAEPVSLISLIANPGEYDGEQVRVVGVAQVEFEQDVLYLNEQDSKHRVLTNAIGLSFGVESTFREETLTGKYVGVEGVFRVKTPGTRRLQVGLLEGITRFEAWHPPPKGGTDQGG